MPGYLHARDPQPLRHGRLRERTAQDGKMRRHDDLRRRLLRERKRTSADVRLRGRPDVRGHRLRPDAGRVRARARTSDRRPRRSADAAPAGRGAHERAPHLSHAAGSEGELRHARPLRGAVPRHQIWRGELLYGLRLRLRRPLALQLEGRDLLPVEGDGYLPALQRGRGVPLPGIRSGAGAASEQPGDAGPERSRDPGHRAERDRDPGAPGAAGAGPQPADRVLGRSLRHERPEVAVAAHQLSPTAAGRRRERTAGPADPEAAQQRPVGKAPDRAAGPAAAATAQPALQPPTDRDVQPGAVPQHRLSPEEFHRQLQEDPALPAEMRAVRRDDADRCCDGHLQLRGI
mmetsp:Transcript_28111/g.64331  ORF Transcript_28111/g.64331 Transcript_28111/m.64331 type:complete len:346 (-) Transcript_28111:802-1839(-)